MKDLWKKVLTIALALTLAAGLVPVRAAGANLLHQETVTVDGRAVSLPAYLVTDENGGGTNYFKLRDIAAALNGTEKQFDVGWDAAAGTVTVTTGRPYAPVGGELSAASAPSAVRSDLRLRVDFRPIPCGAYRLGNNNYMRLRDIAAALDFAVGYDAASKTVAVDTAKGYTVTPFSSNGTTPGNLSNGGAACTDGQYVYYGARDGLYMTGLSGGESVRLVSDEALGYDGAKSDEAYRAYPRFLNTDGEAVYFYSYCGRAGIYRWSPENGEAERVAETDGEVYYLTLQGDRLVYALDALRSSAEAHAMGAWEFWAVHTNGTENRPTGAQIQSGSSFHQVSFAVDGDVVYYTEEARAPQPGKRGGLTKIKLDGTGRAELDATADTWPSWLLGVEDGWVYYTISVTGNGRDYYPPERDVYRVRTDGTGRAAYAASGGRSDVTVHHGVLYGARNERAASGQIEAVQLVRAAPGGTWTPIPGARESVSGIDGAQLDLSFYGPRVSCVLPGWIYYIAQGAAATSEGGGTSPSQGYVYRVSTAGGAPELLSAVAKGLSFTPVRVDGPALAAPPTPDYLAPYQAEKAPPMDERADAALAEYGLTRDAIGIQRLFLTYSGDPKAVRVEITSVTVDGREAEVVEPLPVSDELLAGVRCEADWMTDPANHGKVYTATAQLIITPAGGSAVAFTDTFPFRLESGM